MTRRQAIQIETEHAEAPSCPQRLWAFVGYLGGLEAFFTVVIACAQRGRELRKRGEAAARARGSEPRVVHQLDGKSVTVH
tara:strand:+ start:2102 stop:2341 length:240 start_codon:yes stop_codon:yes gene_type:complete